MMNALKEITILVVKRIFRKNIFFLNKFLDYNTKNTFKY